MNIIHFLQTRRIGTVAKHIIWSLLIYSINWVSKMFVLTFLLYEAHFRNLAQKHFNQITKKQNILPVYYDSEENKAEMMQVLHFPLPVAEPVYLLKVQATVQECERRGEK